MDSAAKEIINQILKETPKDQPFSIEAFSREYLRRKEGLGWQGVFEVELWGLLEDYLKENELIKEYGQTTLYRLGDAAQNL